MILADIPFQLLVSPFGIPIVAITCVFGWMAIASIAEEVGKVMRNRDNSELKLELISRGFTADDVVRIVEAGGKEETQAEHGPHQRHSKPHPAAL